MFLKEYREKRRLKKEKEIFFYVLNLFKRVLHPNYLVGGSYHSLYEFDLMVPQPLVVHVPVKRKGNKVVLCRGLFGRGTSAASGVYIPPTHGANSPQEPECNHGKERILYNGDYSVLAHEYAHYLSVHLKKGGKMLDWEGISELAAGLTDHIYTIEKSFWFRVFGP